MIIDDGRAMNMELLKHCRLVLTWTRYSRKKDEQPHEVQSTDKLGERSIGPTDRYIAASPKSESTGGKKYQSIL